jgi:hypothetical protein
MSKRPAQQKTTPEKPALTPEKQPITPEKTPKKPIKAAESSGSPDLQKSAEKSVENSAEKSVEKSPEESPVKGATVKLSDGTVLSLEPLPYCVVVFDEAKKRKMSVPFIAPFCNLEKEVLDIKRRLGSCATNWNLTYQKKKNIELEEKLLAQEEELKEFRAMKSRAEAAALAAVEAEVFETLEDEDGLETDAQATEKEGAVEKDEEEKEAEIEAVEIDA